MISLRFWTGRGGDAPEDAAVARGVDAAVAQEPQVPPAALAQVLGRGPPARRVAAVAQRTVAGPRRPVPVVVVLERVPALLSVRRVAKQQLVAVDRAIGSRRRRRRHRDGPPRRGRL